MSFKDLVIVEKNIKKEGIRRQTLISMFVGAILIVGLSIIALLN